jgi:hypothetical protein
MNMVDTPGIGATCGVAPKMGGMAPMFNIPWTEGVDKAVIP